VARLRSRKFDRELGAGADPAGAPALAAHAARLTTKGARSTVAASIERLLDAHAYRCRLWGVLPFTDALGANESELRELADVLRGPAPVYAQGVAKLRWLLADGTGPVYTDRHGEALAAHLREARRAIGA
jgi:hypothetical protein